MASYAQWMAALGWTSGAGGLPGVFAKSALVLLGALVLTRLLRGASASTRHQVWTVALVTVLALPALSAVLPAWQVPILPAELATPASSPAVRPSPTSTPAPLPRASAIKQAAPSPKTAAEVLATNAASDANPRGVSFAGSLLDEIDWRAATVGGWLLGVAFLFTRLLVSSLSAWWSVRRAHLVRDEAMLREAQVVQKELAIGTEVGLVQSDRVSMPMAWGIFRPTVVLPIQSRGWTPERRRVVLLHEMAHLKRHDCQTLLLARLVAAIHWFNPLAWIATRRLQAERERACDDLVLTLGTRGSDYAQHLLDIARAMRRSTAPGWAVVAMARPSELEGRLLAILDPNRNRRRATRVATVAGLAAVGLLVLPLAALQPLAFAAVETPQAMQGFEYDFEWGYEQEGQAADPRVREALMIALGDEEPEIREEAARSLGQLEDSAGVPALSEVLQHDDIGQVREAAAWALGMIEDETGVPALSAALSDAEADVRAQAAWALGMIESDSAVDSLGIAVRGDESPQVREQAAWALGMIESDAGVEALAAALSDADEEVREQAAWALGMIEADAGVDALAAALSDADEDVREQAAWALGMSGSPGSVEALSATLRNDVSATVREQAAWALGMIEAEAGLDALLDALTDEDLDVRKKALWAVGMISG